MTEHKYTIFQQKDRWVGIPKLAERLGVKEGENTGEVDIVLSDGRKFSVFALINAFLDRLDKTLAAAAGVEKMGKWDSRYSGSAEEIEAHTIERCAQVAEGWSSIDADGDAIAAAIRALKEEKR